MRPMTPRRRLAGLVAVVFAVAGLGVTAVPGIAWAEEPEAPVLIERSFEELELRRSLPPEVVVSAPGEDIAAWENLKTSLPIFGIEIDTAGTLGDRRFLKFKTVESASRARAIYEAIKPWTASISLGFQLLLVSGHNGNPSKFLKDIDDLPLYSALKGLPFKFTEYQVLSNAFITTSSGEDVELGLSGIRNSKDTFELDVRVFYDPQADMIRLEELDIELKMSMANNQPTQARLSAGQGGLEPYTGNTISYDLLEATLNIKNGDTVVVGGSSIEERTYLLVITAKTTLKEETQG